MQMEDKKMQEASGSFWGGVGSEKQQKCFENGLKKKKMHTTVCFGARI